MLKLFSLVLTHLTNYSFGNSRHLLSLPLLESNELFKGEPFESIDLVRCRSEYNFMFKSKLQFRFQA